MQMMMFVLDDPDQLDDVLNAWSAVGVSGVTIIESSGLYRRQQRRPMGARYAFGLGLSAKRVESDHYTLYAIVPSVDVVRACLKAAEDIVGDLSGPDTGVLASWPLDVVKGVPDTLRDVSAPGDDSSDDATSGDSASAAPSAGTEAGR